MQVDSLYRYPIKGFSPERLDAIAFRTGEYVPGDRLFAIENGPAGFDPAAPRHQPKIKFLMLMRNAAVARIRTRYGDASGMLDAEADGRTVRADAGTPEGRLALEAFIRQTLPRDLRGPPKVLAAPDGFRFTDSRRGFVSIINLASVQDVEAMTGRPVDPLRFRGNVMVTGLAPWAEFDLVGSQLAGPGGLLLKVTKRIERCAATNVDPVTAERDMDIPHTLMRRLGHADCGIYAEVVSAGSLRPGDALRPVAPQQGTLSL